MMKVLIINTNESSGGAAKAANRLYKGLRSSGIEAFMLVQKKESDDEFVIGAKNNIFYKIIDSLRSKLDKLPKLLYGNRKKVPWNVNWLPNPLLFYYIKKINPTVINLHWINNGFISIKQIGKLKKLKIPIVWTLHDSWAFTGGCHIPHKCKRYLKNCGRCPLLGSQKENDLSRRIWEDKDKIFSKESFAIITPSSWLQNCVEKSNLFKNYKIYKIPNTINTDEFKDISKNKARKKLNLDLDKKYILFGAMSATTDKNKGFDLILKSLEKIKQKRDLELLVFGNKTDEIIKTNLPVKFFGRINNDKKINLLYASANLVIVPSRSENLPNVLLEAFSSGTPAVAFEIGGIPDIIDHKKNGYLAKPFDVDDLRRGIEWCVKNDKRNTWLSRNARKKAKLKFCQEVQTENYIKNFKEYINHCDL